MLTLVTGGRAEKSALQRRQVLSFGDAQRIYIATANSDHAPF